MANRRKPLTFSELDAIEPRGKGAILRSAEEVSQEQEMLENQSSGEPETQDTSIPENQHHGTTEGWQSGKRVNQQVRTGGRAKSARPAKTNSGDRSRYIKATYRLSPEALDAIDDAKRLLRRRHGLKVNLEEIAEEAILAAYRDLQVNNNSSNLVIQLSRNLENRTS